MLEHFYITEQMIENLDDDGFTEIYYSMINCNQINPNKWDMIHRRDDTTPIYWFMKCLRYLLNQVEGLDPQIKCKYVSIVFRMILQYKFVLNDPRFARFKPIAIQKARDLREDQDCTYECKVTLNLFLNVIGIMN